MFIFPPGSGCRGEPTFVPPGEELFVPNLTNVKVESSVEVVQCEPSVQISCDSTGVCLENAYTSGRYYFFDLIYLLSK